MLFPIFAPRRGLIFFALALGLSLPGYGQILIETELIGSAAATHITPAQSGNLLVSSTFGEPLIGISQGNFTVTVGFHQPELMLSGLPPAVSENGPAETNLLSPLAEVREVRAFPNPVRNQLTVDLLSYQGEFARLEIVSLQGQIVISQPVNEQRFVEMSQLGDKAAATYYLRGVTANGEITPLRKIVKVTY